jgi:membrane protein implicated in regulation of membrane protease activity
MLITFMRWAPLFWLLFAILLGVIEAATVDLVAIWFAAGAAAAIIPALLGGRMWLQLAVFFVVSILTLAFTRPAAARVLHVRKTSTNADRVIGMMGVVTEDINNITGTGRVQVNGLSWAAKSADGEPIAKDESVLVREITGVTLMVERV